MGSIHLVHSKDSESPYSTRHDVKCVTCNSITEKKMIWQEQEVE